MIVVYHKKFTKRFTKLSPKIQAAFYKKLEIFYKDKYDERLNNHTLHWPFEGMRSIDITGDYRAIFVEHSGNAVVFNKIGTHTELYE